MDNHNRRLLYASAFVRSVATGMIGILLGVYLVTLDLNSFQCGLVISCGLAGAALAALLATFKADQFGRKRFLIALTAIGAAGGIAAAGASGFAVLSVAALVGMLNGMGRDRGAALVIEQSLLPATTTDEKRTLSFAWYNVLQDIGHALGSLLAGLPTLLSSTLSLEKLVAFRLALGLYVILSLIPLFIYLALSQQITAPVRQPTRRIAPQTRTVLWKISSLFAVDSLGGGFLTTAMVSMFFVQRFGVDIAVISFLFVGARVANALSHLAAAWLSKRIGLVNTMVFTHIPSSLLLLTVAFAPNFLIAALLFLLREGLVEMDVPTRQSYVMAVVEPHERTFASGVTHLVRLGGWSVAPGIAGFLMKTLALGAPLVAGSAIKISYDILLYFSFRKIKPPEEIA